MWFILADVSNEQAKQFWVMYGETILGASKSVRNALCQETYRNLLKHDKVNLEILHIYINICTENSIELNVKEVLESIKFKITADTYKILLKNVCEKGNVTEASIILELMKKESITIDEFVFNNLVLAHSISG